MRKFFRISGLAALALGATALTAQAQEKATELTVGVLGFSSTSCSGCEALTSFKTGGSDNYVTAGLGGGSLAVGLYLSPGIALEPTLSFSTLSISGVSVTTFGLGLALPYYFDKGWGRRGIYLAPRVTYSSVSVEGESGSQVALGVGLGTKVPLNDLAALRLQANFDYGFENDDLLSTTSFGALIGLSVFLK